MLTLAITVAISLPVMVAAAGLPGPIVECKGITCTCQDLMKTAQNLLNTGIYFAVFISAILFAWAGLKMISGQGNAAKNIIGQRHTLERHYRLGHHLGGMAFGRHHYANPYKLPGLERYLPGPTVIDRYVCFGYSSRRSSRTPDSRSGNHC